MKTVECRLKSKEGKPYPMLGNSKKGADELMKMINSFPDSGELREKISEHPYLRNIGYITLRDILKAAEFMKKAEPGTLQHLRHQDYIYIKIGLDETDKIRRQIEQINKSLIKALTDIYQNNNSGI